MTDNQSQLRRERVRDVGHRWIDIGLKAIIAGAGIYGSVYLATNKQFFENMHTEQRQQTDDITLVVNMVTAGDSGHRTMALATATVFAEENRVPARFLDAVAAYVRQNDTLTQEAQNNAVVAQVASGSPLTSKSESIDASLPIRVYIQYSDQDDKYKVEAIRQSLNGLTADGKTIIAPPVEHVPTNISAPILKCFRPEECKKFGGPLVAALRIVVRHKISAS